jgi:hypothetical protein
MGVIAVRSMRRCRMLLASSALTVGLTAIATPAQAVDCTANATGIANSGGAAAVAKTTACAPANGRPSGIDTGRKVG